MAARAGTSRTRLSAYEHGRTDPGLVTLQRIAAAAGLEIAAVPSGTARVRDRIVEIGRAVAVSGRSPAVRLVAELVAWVRDGVVSVDVMTTDPGTTGSPEWDAVVAGVVEMLAHELGTRVPSWTAAPSRRLEDPWFVTSLRSLWPEVLADTPAPLAARNVFLSASSLRSV